MPDVIQDESVEGDVLRLHRDDVPHLEVLDVDPIRAQLPKGRDGTRRRGEEEIARHGTSEVPQQESPEPISHPFPIYSPTGPVSCQSAGAAGSPSASNAKHCWAL